MMIKSNNNNNTLILRNGYYYTSSSISNNNNKCRIVGLLLILLWSLCSTSTFLLLFLLLTTFPDPIIGITRTSNNNEYEYEANSNNHIPSYHHQHQHQYHDNNHNTEYYEADEIDMIAILKEIEEKQKRYARRRNDLEDEFDKEDNDDDDDEIMGDDEDDEDDEEIYELEIGTDGGNVLVDDALLYDTIHNGETLPDNDDDDDWDYYYIEGIMEQFVLEIEQQIAEFSYHAFYTLRDSNKNNNNNNNDNNPPTTTSTSDEGIMQDKLREIIRDSYEFMGPPRLLPYVVMDTATVTLSVTDIGTYNLVVMNEEYKFLYEVDFIDGPIHVISLEQKMFFVDRILKLLFQTKLSSTELYGADSSTSSGRTSSTTKATTTKSILRSNYQKKLNTIRQRQKRKFTKRYTGDEKLYRLKEIFANQALRIVRFDTLVVHPEQQQQDEDSSTTTTRKDRARLLENENRIRQYQEQQDMVRKEQKRRIDKQRREQEKQRYLQDEAEKQRLQKQQEDIEKDNEQQRQRQKDIIMNQQRYLEQEQLHVLQQEFEGSVSSSSSSSIPVKDTTSSNDKEETVTTTKSTNKKKKVLDDTVLQKLEIQRRRYVKYQRYLLTQLYYALTNTTDVTEDVYDEYKPKTKGSYNRHLFQSSSNQLRTKGYWLDNTISYCDWDGIMCAYEDKFIDQQKIIQHVIRKSTIRQQRELLLLSSLNASSSVVTNNNNTTIQSSKKNTNNNSTQSDNNDDEEEDDDDDEFDENLVLDYEFHHHDTMSPYPYIPKEAITRIELGNNHGVASPYASELIGTIPGDILTQFEYLLSFVVSHNNIHGTIPNELGAKLQFLQRFDVTNNFLIGTIPWTLFYYEHLPVYKQRHHLRECSLANNLLSGTLPIPPSKSLLQYDVTPDGTESVLFYLDVGHNLLSGTIPTDFVQRLSSLEYLFLNHNYMIGSVPSASNWYKLTDLQILDLSLNHLTGIDLSSPPTSSTDDNTIVDGNDKIDSNHTVPSSSLLLTKLRDLNLADNAIAGTFPTSLYRLSNLHCLFLEYNDLTGPIPSYYYPSTNTVDVNDDENDDDNTNNKVESHGETQPIWNLMPNLAVLTVQNNAFSGSIPVPFILSLKSSLRILDLSYNELTGTIPTEIGLMSGLMTIDAHGNYIQGSIPNEMVHMNPNLRLNFTDNLLTGTIPGMFCGYGASSMNMLYREFGCDAVLCRTGTFNIHGHATLHSACRVCPVPADDEEQINDPRINSTVLGQVACPTVQFLHGDLDGNGFLSGREILRMIYVDTLGRFWGKKYQTWADMSIDECDLEGITCVNDEITKIQLSKAEMCSNGEDRPGPKQYCKGLPSEIGLLTALEVFSLQGQKYLRGTIPTEVGQLSKLSIVDFSSCSSLSGTVPSEIGYLTNLMILMLSKCRLTGTLPTTIASLSDLEILHVSNNMIGGTLPSEIGMLRNLKELMVSRNMFTGKIPTQIGRMAKLENFEAYLNKFDGRIPPELALPTIKRIDAFANQLTGTIPATIARVKGLQILHLKDNRLTGTIPAEFGILPYLSWFDISQNKLHGTIPSSFGHSTALEDFRIVDNYIHGTFPAGLCYNNPKINDADFTIRECHNIACPQGWYSSRGHATVDQPCKKCPEGTSNLYLSSSFCEKFSEEDILAMFFEVMNGHDWPSESKKHWGSYDVPHCEWGGIECDENGEVITIGFPLRSVIDDFKD